jgi:precorrin-3B synthase
MKRGWCPSLYEPMAAKDGLLLRVKPFAGAVSANAAMLLAAAATRFGNGMIQLTNRANMQFRGFNAESAAAFADIVGGLGLAETKPGAERRRNVLVSPLTGHDTALHPATLDVARALEALLVETEAFSALPAKFGIVVDGGGSVSVLGGDEALISLDGVNAAVVAPFELVDRVSRMVYAFIEQGPPSRMCDANMVGLLTAAGLVADLKLPHGTSISPIGAASFGAGVGVAFGLMDAAALQELASASGDAGMFITPWRSVMLAGRVPNFAHPALITATDDKRLSIKACIGQQGCEHGSVDALADAALLAQSGRFGSVSIHVSGCAKGCAQRGASAITLVGDAGRYDFVRHGRADAAPVLRGLTVSDIVAHPALEDFA